MILSSLPQMTTFATETDTIFVDADAYEVGGTMIPPSYVLRLENDYHDTFGKRSEMLRFQLSLLRHPPEDTEEIYLRLMSDLATESGSSTDLEEDYIDQLEQLLDHFEKTRDTRQYHDNTDKEYRETIRKSSKERIWKMCIARVNQYLADEFADEIEEMIAVVYESVKDPMGIVRHPSIWAKVRNYINISIIVDIIRYMDEGYKGGSSPSNEFLREMEARECQSIEDKAVDKMVEVFADEILENLGEEYDIGSGATPGSYVFILEEGEPFDPRLMAEVIEATSDYDMRWLH